MLARLTTKEQKDVHNYCKNQSPFILGAHFFVYLIDVLGAL